jgi:hypothetical protein
MDGALVDIPRVEAGQPRLHCLSFVPVEHLSGALVGFANFHVPRWRARLNGCGVFINDGNVSVALPVRAQIGSDKRIREDANGRTLYEPIITFDDPQTAHLVSAAAVQALAAYRPDLFEKPGR